MAESFINPSADNIAALQAMQLDGPVVMVNLLRFRPDGGAEEYERYAAAALPFLSGQERSCDTWVTVPPR